MTYAIVQASESSAQGLRFYGGAREFWRYRGHEVMLEGPFETGKTIAALSKLHALLCKYHNCRALMVRETYKSLVQSAVVTYEKKVLPYPPEDPKCGVVKYGGEKPDFYDYPNGSRLVCGGLDNPDKVLSAEYDYIYVPQAEELELDAWEKLVARATGRAGNAPYPQVMGDCNPSYPSHWILFRKPLKRFQQLHEHNPSLFNQETGEITERGKVAMAILDALTGVRYLRGRRGLWAAAEGVVFDNWAFQNITDEAEYNPDLPVIWGVDDGYAAGQGVGTASYHPRVILFAQETAQGGFNVFDECVVTGELSEVTVANALAMPYRKPEVAYTDSSAAELRGRLWNADIMTVAATHPVHEGIKNLRRLICDGQGVRLFRIHPRCTMMAREFASYRYDDASRAVAVGEPKPLKLDDHTVDAARYLVWHARFED